MNIVDQIAQERPLVEQARTLAKQYGRPFTVWRDGDNVYLRAGRPSDDTEAQRNGWAWMAITYPACGDNWMAV